MRVLQLITINISLLLVLSNKISDSGEEVSNHEPSAGETESTTHHNNKSKEIHARLNNNSTKHKQPSSEHINSSELPSNKPDHLKDPSVEKHDGEIKASESKRGEDKSLRKMDPLGTSLMFVVGLITTSINLVSCGYLLYLVYILSKRVGFHSSLRLLAYACCFDMLVGGFFTLSIVYSTLYDSLIEGFKCQIIGFIINLLTACDMLLIGFISLSTYTKVLHKFTLPRGRYDWILFSVVVGIPLIASCILANYHAFGAESLWCLIDDETLAGKISTVCMVALYFAVGLLVLICYFSVRLYSRRSIQDSSIVNLSISPDTPPIKSNMLDEIEAVIYSASTVYGKGDSHRYHRKSILTLSYAEIKLETHMLVHLFQYSPPCFHLIAMLAGYRSSWVFTLAILSTNLGGLFQLWAYLHHQKKKRSQFQDLYQSHNESKSIKDSTIQSIPVTTNSLSHRHHHNNSQGRYSVLSTFLPLYNADEKSPPST